MRDLKSANGTDLPPGAVAHRRVSPPYWIGDAIVVALAILPLALALLPPSFSLPETAGGWLRAAGRAAGVVGLGWLFLTGILAVRIPGFDRPFGGLVRVWRIHHMLGTGAFLLLLAHPLLLAFAMLPTSPAAANAALFPPMANWEIWAGWGALLAMMTFLAPTYSFFGRPEYERWKRLHLLSGATILLGLVHALPLASTPGRAAAWSLWAVPGALALSAFAWRAWLAMHARRLYRVTAVARPASRVVELSLRPESGELLRYEPGQFVYLTPDDPALAAGRGEEHPYTLSSAPGEPVLRIAVKDLGDASRALQTVAIGSRTWVEGPYGRFFPYLRREPELWIGGGIGVTPFLARLRAMTSETGPADIRFVYCARDCSRAYFIDEIRDLAGRVQGIEVIPHFFADEGPLAASFLSKAVPDLRERTAFVCGPLPLMKLAQQILRRAGVPRERIHSEEFTLL